VLSFIAPTVQAGSAQKSSIDASIKAGVRRFAPSEWATYVNPCFLLVVIYYFPYPFISGSGILRLILE
jgi:hypothetical protein